MFNYPFSASWKIMGWVGGVLYSTRPFTCRVTLWSFSWISMTVLESAHPEDSETLPESWIWWRFGWDIEGRTQVIPEQKFPVPKLEVWVEMSVVFTRRISRHKMWWGMWQWEGQIGFGAVTGPDMAEGLQTKNLADVSKSHSAMSGPVSALSTHLALPLPHPPSHLVPGYPPGKHNPHFCSYL